MSKTKLFLSARITEKFFSPEEITEIKDEIASCSKSEFIRRAIKSYLDSETELPALNYKESSANNKEELTEIKALLKENYTLLKEIKQTKLTSGKEEPQVNSDTYQGQEQEAKIEEAIDLLEQF
jgi:Arc/MetJ-type ribon-helix-helix transcriptional regulator